VQALSLLRAILAGPRYRYSSLSTACCVGGRGNDNGCGDLLVGTPVLGAAELPAREGVPALSDTAGAPWWVWLGGFLGAFYVAASIILTPGSGQQIPWRSSLPVRYSPR
jgi:hypothetical protein